MIGAIKFTNNKKIKNIRKYFEESYPYASNMISVPTGYVATTRGGTVLKLNNELELIWKNNKLAMDANPVKPPNSNQYIIAGDDPTNSKNLKAAAMTPDGEINWAKTYNIGFKINTEYRDTGIPGNGDGIIICGRSLEHGLFSEQTWMAKISVDGELEWEKPVEFGIPNAVVRDGNEFLIASHNYIGRGKTDALE